MGVVQTYDGTVRTVDGVVKTGCCCDTCCDDEGGPPNAGFSFLQVCASPCCFAFTDESVSGTCGSIASGRWLVDGVEFSTDSNPTACFDGSGPWDVTREVTTSSGCTDSVVMEVSCEGYPCDCPGPSTWNSPDQILLTVSGFTANPPCTQADCDALNGTFVLTRIPGDCVWLSDVFSQPSCLTSSEPGMQYRLASLAGGAWRLNLSEVPSTGLYYQWDKSGLTCSTMAGTHVLTGTIGNVNCGTSPTIEIDVPDLDDDCP